MTSPSSTVTGMWVYVRGGPAYAHRGHAVSGAATGLRDFGVVADASSASGSGSSAMRALSSLHVTLTGVESEVTCDDDCPLALVRKGPIADVDCDNSPHRSEDLVTDKVENFEFLYVNIGAGGRVSSVLKDSSGRVIEVPGGYLQRVDLPQVGENPEGEHGNGEA